MAEDHNVVAARVILMIVLLLIMVMVVREVEGAAVHIIDGFLSVCVAGIDACDESSLNKDCHLKYQS